MNYLFDNNLSPQLARALRTLGKPVAHVTEITDLGAAAPDDLILDYAANWQYTLVTRDRAMTRTPHFRALVSARALGLIVVHTGNARQLGAWDIAKLMVRGWDAIDDFVQGRTPPFLGLLQANARVVPYKPR